MHRKLFTDKITDGLGKSKLSSGHKPSSCPSLMARGFRFHAFLCRLCGCFFIRDLYRSKKESAPKARWKDWYNLYSCCCLALLLWMEQNTIVTLARQLSNPKEYLDNGLRIFLQLLLFMKMAANYLCMFASSSEIITFYRRASALEERIGIPCCGCCSPRGFFWSDVQRVCMCIFYCSAAMVVNAIDADPDDSALVRALAFLKLLLNMFFYFVYDSVYAVALRSSSQVLCTYIEDQLIALKGCIESWAYRFGCHASDAQRVQAVRLNLATVVQLKEEVNHIWRWPLVISSLCVLLLPCICVHEASRPGFIAEQRYAIAIITVYMAYEYGTLVYVSQCLINKTKKLKDICKMARSLENPAFRQQVQELYGSLDPDDMALKGADFFHLKMSLLISMAASVITYAVILQQTAESIHNSRSAASLSAKFPN